MLLCFYSSIILRAEGSSGPPTPSTLLSTLIQAYPRLLNYVTGDPHPPLGPQNPRGAPLEPLEGAQREP